MRVVAVLCRWRGASEDENQQHQAIFSAIIGYRYFGRTKGDWLVSVFPLMSKTPASCNDELCTHLYCTRAFSMETRDAFACVWVCFIDASSVGRSRKARTLLRSWDLSCSSGTGFVGCAVNAVALLPLIGGEERGSTDSMAMAAGVPTMETRIFYAAGVFGESQENKKPRSAQSVRQNCVGCVEVRRHGLGIGSSQLVWRGRMNSVRLAVTACWRRLCPYILETPRCLRHCCLCVFLVWLQ